jgi:hypothetical protein
MHSSLALTLLRKFAQAHRAMPSAVRSALVRSALERLSGPWLRDAAAFGLLQGRSWVMSWPPGPAPAPPDLTAELDDSPQLALGLVGAKPAPSSRLDADAAAISALIRSERDSDLLAAELVDRRTRSSRCTIWPDPAATSSTCP